MCRTCSTSSFFFILSGCHGDPAAAQLPTGVRVHPASSARLFFYFFCWFCFFFLLTTSPFSSYIRTCTLNTTSSLLFLLPRSFRSSKIQTRTGPGLTDVLWTWLIPTLVGLVGIKKKEEAVQSKHSIRNKTNQKTRFFLFCCNWFWIIGTDGFRPWSWHWMTDEIEVKIITEKLCFFFFFFRR